MKSLIHALVRHKHLIAISLLSALFVILLQLVTNIVFNDKPKTGIALHIEDISASITSLAQVDEQKDQFMSTLTDAELTELSQMGTVEDTSITQLIPTQEVSVEKLFVSFDDQITTGLIHETLKKGIRINVGDTGNFGISLCGKSQQQCAFTLVSRSAEVMPVSAKYTQDLTPGEGLLLITTKDSPGPYRGSFSSSPLILSVQAM